MRSSVTVVLLLAAAALTSGCGDDRDQVPPPGGEPGTTVAATSGGGGEGGAGGAGSSSSGNSTSSSVSSASTADATSTGVGGEGGFGPEGCDDGTQNGTETDIDCGGECPTTCQDGQGCVEGADCASGICNEEGLCETPECDDELKNGDEGDVDCGGTSCPSCGAGKECNVPGDCRSGYCIENRCECPAGMTIVPADGGESYCMDSTEVTYEEYDAFLTSSPTSDLPECAFNVSSFTPSDLWPPEQDELSENAPNYILKPVRFVDWCDAATFCADAGKRLCGSIAGGPTLDADLANSDVDQWFNACSADDANVFPYSGAFNGARCTESVDGPVAAPINVREEDGDPVQTCLGGYSNLYQLSGNVAEWVDSCDGSSGASDSCVVRGGSFASDDAALLECDDIARATRNTTSAEIGFRCCQ